MSEIYSSDGNTPPHPSMFESVHKFDL